MLDLDELPPLLFSDFDLEERPLLSFDSDAMLLKAGVRECKNALICRRPQPLYRDPSARTRGDSQRSDGSHAWQKYGACLSILYAPWC